MSDAGYTALLSHLHSAKPNLPLETLQAALSHHLSTLLPLPTPLAATIISAPLFLTPPFNNTKLQTLNSAFRYAVHLKCNSLFKDHEAHRHSLGAVFRQGVRSQLVGWTKGLAHGLQGGHPLLRVACASGTLLGLEDVLVEKEVKVERTQVEDELVLAVAEAMDLYSSSSTSSSGDWEKEFQPPGQVDALTLAFIQASQAIPLIPAQKLRALPLSHLLRLLTTTLASAFKSGNILANLKESIASNAPPVHIPSTSPLAGTLREISTSPLAKNIASIAKTIATIINVLFLPPFSKAPQVLDDLAQTLGVLRGVTASIDQDWRGSSLSAVEKEEDIAPESRELVQSLWTILKTLLFSIVMISDAGLTSVTFVPPSAIAYPASAVAVNHDGDMSVLPALSRKPESIARMVLQTFWDLAFVISEFGGVINPEGQGFKELRKVFYMAVDILVHRDADVGSGEAHEGEKFIKELAADYKSSSTRYTHAKQAFALACAEQLVSVLSEQSIELDVVPMCLRHLSDPSNREVYESSHSTMLALFAAHAQRNSLSAATITTTSEDARSKPSVIEKLVPFYSQCLIDNSHEGQLSTAQLCLAYSALVRSASASASGTGVLEPEDDNHKYALAWYCIDQLLLAVDGNESAGVGAEGGKEREMRLKLALVGTISAVPLSLMMKVLEEIRRRWMVDDLLDSPKENEGDLEMLLDAIYVEISERVGDREKEAALVWWFKTVGTLQTTAIKNVGNDGVKGETQTDRARL